MPKAGFAFVSSSFWDRIIPCSMVSISLMKHTIQRFFLILAPTSTPVGVATSFLLMIFSWVIHFALTFLPRRSEVFFPILQRSVIQI
jgi:hypothetical protein